jgi:hypothetical protein
VEAESLEARYEADAAFRLRLPASQLDALRRGLADATRGAALVETDT